MFRLIACALLAALPAPLAVAQQLAAQTAPAPTASEALTQRIAELPAILRGEGDYDAYFSPEFRAQVPKAKFAEIAAQIAALGGAVTGVTITKLFSSDAAQIEIEYQNGTAPGRIAVDPATHMVSGLLVTGFTGRETSIEGISDSLRKLPGRTGFAWARLGGARPDLLVGVDADRPLAIGSAFKLVILAELVRATDAGERKWTDMVTLDGSPLPGGTYTQSPRGTRVSLHDLAVKMISISDNSATDILLRALGRRRVEAMLPVVGIADPAKLRPLLSTLDMFKLKGTDHLALASQYLAKDEGGRRAMLDGPVAAEPLTAIDPALFKDGKPVLIDTLEWFESPMDLVRVMDWLRVHTESGPGAEARAILGINPGIPPASAAAWSYVGYKGGSEPGVLNMTLLLQGKDGMWFVLTASWNNPGAGVDLMRFAGLMSRAADIAATAR